MSVIVEGSRVKFVAGALRFQARDAVVVSVPVHPNTWFKLLLPSSQRQLTVRRSAFELSDRPVPLPAGLPWPEALAASASPPPVPPAAPPAPSSPPALLSVTASPSVSARASLKRAVSEPGAGLKRAHKSSFSKKARVSLEEKKQQERSKMVRIVSGKSQGQLGRVLKSGNGFYSVLLSDGTEMMKRRAELEWVQAMNQVPEEWRETLEAASILLELRSDVLFARSESLIDVDESRDDSDN